MLVIALHCEDSKCIMRLLGTRKIDVLGTAGEKEGRPAPHRGKKPGVHQAPCFSSVSSVTHPCPGYPCSVLWEEGLASISHVGTHPSPEGRDMNLRISNQDSKGTFLALPLPGLRDAVGLSSSSCISVGHFLFMPSYTTHKLCLGILPSLNFLYIV